MVPPADQPSGDPLAEQCRKLKRQLNELVDMTTGLENRLRDEILGPKERRDLEGLKLRYAREALQMMMKIDYLEDPEDEDWDEEDEEDEEVWEDED